MKRVLFFLLAIIAYAQMPAQFLESFDTGIPSTWTIIDNDGQGGKWQYNAGTSYQGAGKVRINYEANAHDDYLISPKFNVTNGLSDQVSFYAGGSGPNFPESFDVKLSTTGTRVADFTTTLGSVKTISDIAHNGYINYTYDLSPYAGSEVYVAIVATSTAAFRLNVDEFSVGPLPDCPKPTNFTFSTLTATSAKLTWKPAASEKKWEIKYGLAGFDPANSGNTISIEQTPEVTINDLNPITQYDVYIREKCDTSEGYSGFTGTLSFITLCQPPNVPFTEGFENNYINGDDLDGCWTQQRTAGSSYWKTNSTLTSQNRAPRSGQWNIYLTYGNTTWMFYPAQVTAGVQYTLSLYARQSNTMNAFIEASYGGSPKAADMVKSIIPSKEIFDGDYQLVDGHFTPTETGIIYIGIKGQIPGGFFAHYLSVDDISVQEYNPCPQPKYLQAQSTSNSIAVSWTPGGSETKWIVKYGEPGFDPATSGQSIVVEGTPSTTITGLSSAHNYSLFIQSQCGDENESSNFIGPLTIGTKPVNDNVCDAIPIFVGQSCSGSSYSNVGATLENNEEFGSCFGAPGNKTVWFKFIAPDSGKVKVTTDFEGGTLYDTELAVYEAPADCTDLSTLGSEVGCDEDGGNTGQGFLSTLMLNNLTPGNTYYIQVNGFINFYDGPLEGTFCLEVHDNQVLSVKEDSFAKFNYYPNPVDNQLYVKSEQSIQKIKITSLSGQKVVELLPKSENFEVSTKSLKTGTYILSVTIDGKEKSFKILKK